MIPKPLRERIGAKGNRSINSGRLRLLLREGRSSDHMSEFLCLARRRSAAMQPNLPIFWIYSAALIPETVTPVRLLLCSRGLCTHGGSLFASSPNHFLHA